MLKRTPVRGCLWVLMSCLGAVGFCVAGAVTDPAPAAWQRVPAILKRIVPPVFPGRELVITNFGAVGDGLTDCTRAFADAIHACHQAGGGRVTVPAGTFLSGAIHLESNVNLHL